MRMIRDDAEAMLNGALEAMRARPGATRCIHIALSCCEWIRPASIPTIARLVQEHFHAYDGRLFVCADGDMFVVLKELTSEACRAALQYLGVALETSTPEKWVRVYELGKDWSTLSVLAEEKLLAYHRRQEARKAEQRAGQADAVRASILTGEISPNAIHTMAHKRRRHERPEIMVVEDDPFSRRLVHKALEKDFRVHMAPDGATTISTYLQAAPDLLFLDIELPDISGHDLLGKLLSFDPDAYIVMLSGNGDKANVMRAVENGAKGFVAKPFTREKLLQYIERCPAHRAVM